MTEFEGSLTEITQSLELKTQKPALSEKATCQPNQVDPVGPDGEVGPSIEQESPFGGSKEDSMGEGKAPPVPEIPRAKPTQPNERLLTLDLLRGFALCGILLMNILNFAWPEGAYGNPAYLYYTVDSIGDVPKDQEESKDETPKDEETEKGKKKKKEKKSLGSHRVYPHGDLESAAVSGPLDRAEWVFANLFVENKMRTLFSMLFGAGVVLMNRHSKTRKGSPFWLHYRRMGWLLLIGAAHGYFLWDGDILYLYAAIGLGLYPLLRVPPAWLIGAGLFLFIAPLGLVYYAPYGVEWFKQRGAELTERQKQESKVEKVEVAEDGEKAKEPWTIQGLVDQAFIKGYKALEERRIEGPSPEKVTRSIREHNRVGYWEWFKERWTRILGMHIAFLLLGFLFFGWPMVLGMGFMKLGFFEGAWSQRAYGVFAMIGYCLGIPLNWYALMVSLGGGIGLATNTQVILPLESFAQLLITFANASGLVWLYKTGRLEWIASRLQAAGRMALSNYLLDTVICSVIFSGAFGLYGVIPRIGLLGIAILIWTFHLLVSPIWLTWFQFGPMEWFWRSLTYWKFQSLLVNKEKAGEVLPAITSESNPVG